MNCPYPCSDAHSDLLAGAWLFLVAKKFVADRSQRASNRHNAPIFRKKNARAESAFKPEGRFLLVPAKGMGCYARPNSLAFRAPAGRPSPII